MRLRNVKNADEILKNSIYYIDESTQYINKWNDLFKNNNPIMLEVGMGKGDFIINMAKLHPDWNFIGVEKYESVLIRAVQKLDKEKLSNVRVINIDAKYLDTIFNREIDTLYLNFSDPWPKKRHYKRRLTYRDYLSIYDKCFIDSAKIKMKTDNDTLFESTLIELNNYGYIFNEINLDLWKTDKENVKTEYEIKFANKGFKIKYIFATKKVGN